MKLYAKTESGLAPCDVLTQTDVTNKLDSTDTDKPLSAAMGKKLETEKQDELNSDNPLSLSAGGLGGSAEDAAGARALIGAWDPPTLLWTNASPTSTFPGQLINGAWSGFTSFILEYTVYIAEVSHRCVAFVPSGESTPFHYLGAFATNYWRQTSINTSGVYFSDAWYRADGGAATSDNSKMIPYKIWGVKEMTL